MEHSRLATPEEMEQEIPVNCVISYTNGDLGFSSLGFTALGYVPKEGATWGEWMAAGQFIRTIERFKSFAQGDWLVNGERKWGEVYAQALDEFQWGSLDKLKKLAWVARNVPIQNRRAELTWSHHHNVAALPVEDQSDWLEFAIVRQLSANELRLHIKDAYPSLYEKPAPVTIDHDAGNGAGMPDAGLTLDVDDLDGITGGGSPGIPDRTSANAGWDNQRTVIEGDADDDYGVEMDMGEDGTRPTMRVQVPDDPGKAASVLFGTFGEEWCLKLVERLGVLVADRYLD